MTEFDMIAYAMLGVSSSISAVQIGRWLLNANPRVIINAGRWSLAALVVLTPVVLLWLSMSGRSTLAMMLAAFVLPVFVQGGLRWRQLFGPLLNFRCATFLVANRILTRPSDPAALPGSTQWTRISFGNPLRY